MKFKFPYLLLVLLFVSFQTYAQRKEITAGDLLFEEFQFDEATVNYELALLKNPTNTIYIYRQLAKCNLYSFKYTRAEFYLEKIIASENPTNED